MDNAKGFVFVDGTKTDRLTRKHARSHAMKGKNLGKTHQRSQARGHVRHVTIQQRGDCTRRILSSQPVGAHRHLNVDNPLQLCASLPYRYFPGTTSRSLDIVKTCRLRAGTRVLIDGKADVWATDFTAVLEAVYYPQLQLSLDNVKSYWIRMMFVDAVCPCKPAIHGQGLQGDPLTAYHCSLALMATLNGFVFASNPLSMDAVRHLAKAVGLVNEKLATPDALASSSISVVNFLVIREMFRGDKYSAEIHLNGLRQMIALRGGLLALQDDQTLALKICKTEIDYALRYGTLPNFHTDFVRYTSQALQLNERVDHVNSCYSRLSIQNIDPILGKILLDVITLVNWLNGPRRDHQLEADALQRSIVSIGYRLLKFNIVRGPSMRNILDDVYHIGLIAFLTSLFLQSNGRGFLKYTLVAERLKNVVNRSLDQGDSASIFWLLAVGAVSVLEQDDQAWTTTQMSRAAGLAGLESWGQARLLLLQFPWITTLHDDLGRQVWECSVKELSTDSQ